MARVQRVVLAGGTIAIDEALLSPEDEFPRRRRREAQRAAKDVGLARAER